MKVKTIEEFQCHLQWVTLKHMTLMGNGHGALQLLIAKLNSFI